jgi:hypothetical protein
LKKFNSKLGIGKKFGKNSLRKDKQIIHLPRTSYIDFFESVDMENDDGNWISELKALMELTIKRQSKWN